MDGKNNDGHVDTNGDMNQDGGSSNSDNPEKKQGEERSEHVESVGGMSNGQAELRQDGQYDIADIQNIQNIVSLERPVEPQEVY